MLCNDTATTEIYTLTLHDALPSLGGRVRGGGPRGRGAAAPGQVLASRARRGRPCRPPSRRGRAADRKSTRLNSSHANIADAVFCLKKKKQPSTSAPASSSAYHTSA